ncbi:hypothetical protein C1J03_12550 [Sulfitobacter sp. SK012]|uniref:hypothetical protein n=1 Tax=Sulfitobacter sp. SK012 TaxID=1389005 RepID=UPI000E0C7D45|nr:hypothetical protein [Sulfitobacter sp. SK012]AXI46780.1 hypothetical protein C1J03_12550 [Sulfitobacter sp. SK012]
MHETDTVIDRMVEQDCKKLHFCQFDHALLPMAANYPIDLAHHTSLPDVIRAAYGVDPHPDMPDGVYSRMNSRLEKNMGAAGYYLCKSATTAQFWISIGLFPTTNGIIASHFQATSPQLSQFAKFFAQLKHAEIAGLSAEESAAQLVELMVSEGIADYRAIATTIMAEEMAKRGDRKKTSQSIQLKLLDQILCKLEKIETYSCDIGTLSGRSRLIPYNLKIQASQLEWSGGPISVIASNHQELSDSMLRITAEIQKTSGTEIDKLNDAIAYIAQSAQVAEVLDISQGPCGAIDKISGAVRKELNEVVEESARRVQDVLADINKTALAMNRISHQMRRALCAMEMTRVLCKIEHKREITRAEGLGDVATQLLEVQQALSQRMSLIDDAVDIALSLAAQVTEEISA